MQQYTVSWENGNIYEQMEAQKTSQMNQIQTSPIHKMHPDPIPTP